MSRHKKTIFASITLLFSAVLTFLFINLLVNIFAMQLFSQEWIPRGWKGYVGQFYRTLYVQAHDRKLEEWTALLGDSYAEGAGDAYSTGEKKYNLVHYLRDRRLENFLIFGRSGFGSMTAAQEFMIASKEMSDAWFLPDIDKPNQIIILFYEGNDLTDNLRHLEARNYDYDDLRSFVIDEITQPSDFRRRVDYYLPLLRPIYHHTKSFIIPVQRRSTKENRTPTHGQAKEETTVNSFLTNAPGASHRTIVVNKRLQSAAMELGQDELDLAIDVFHESVAVISTIYSTSPIFVVYVPSPVSVYKWNDPIHIQTWSYQDRNITTKRENDLRSDYIRNRIATFAADKNIGFIDPTDNIRTQTDVKILHGPIDWKHLNGEGYSYLSVIVDEQRN